MKFLIITGMSGAGKTQVIRCLEDMDYYCIDNMPPALVPRFAEMFYTSGGKIDKVAMVVDMRGGDMFEDLSHELDVMDKNGYRYDILFLDASDDVLVKRYKETRRVHPLAKNGRLIDGIKEEREKLKSIKHRASHVIDTSMFSASQLRDAVAKLVLGNEAAKGLVINVSSFGFKYGIMIDADLVFDVRFLPNPFYIDELKRHTGLEECVRSYVMSFSQTKEFLDMLEKMVTYLIPHYIEEGKQQLVIGIGCTGGRHRSVTIAEELYRYLKEKGYAVVSGHRDIDRDKYQINR